MVISHSMHYNHCSFDSYFIIIIIIIIIIITQYNDGAPLTVWSLISVKPESYPSPEKPMSWSLIITYVDPQ
jgi:hypothetical protein